MARTPGLKTIPLSRVESIIEKEREDQWDLYAPVSDVHLDVHHSLSDLPDRYRVTVKAGKAEHPVGLTPTALKQMSNVTGVPMAFLERVPPSLGVKVLRCMLALCEEADGRDLLFRMKGRERPRLRAILPQSYVRLDDRDLFAEVRDRLEGTSARAHRVSLDDDTLFLRILLGERHELGGGRRSDPAFTVLDVIGSETGTHPLEVRTGLLRVVCSNGLTEMSDAQRALRTRYTRLGRPAFEDALTSTLGSVLDRGAHLAATMAETRVRVVTDPQEEIDRVVRRYRLGSPRGRLAQWMTAEVLKEMDLFGVAKFDIVQAMTAVARGLEHRDRMRLEDAAGAYLMEG